MGSAIFTTYLLTIQCFSAPFHRPHLRDSDNIIAYAVATVPSENNLLRADFFGDASVI